MAVLVGTVVSGRPVLLLKAALASVNLTAKAVGGHAILRLRSDVAPSPPGPWSSADISVDPTDVL